MMKSRKHEEEEVQSLKTTKSNNCKESEKEEVWNPKRAKFEEEKEDYKI